MAIFAPTVPTYYMYYEQAKTYAYFILILTTNYQMWKELLLLLDMQNPHKHFILPDCSFKSVKNLKNLLLISK